MNSLQDCYTLPNGVKIPCVGLGTYLTDDGETCVRAVKAAIEAGYRHIDTDVAYGNEASVGKAVRECGLPREQIFVTSKLRNVNQGYKETKAAFEVTMKELGLEYLDLYLIHWPIARGHKQDWQEHSYQTWRASLTEPPVVTTSSTSRTFIPGFTTNPRRSVIFPSSRSAKKFSHSR